MHYYQFNIGDYRRDTHYLSLLEHGVYRQLLDMYYLSEEPIPKETEVVFRRLSAITEVEQKAVLFVLSEFFVSSEKGWINPRCDDEISQYHSKADRARSNGKLGGRPKKTKEVISGLAKENQNEPKQKLTNKPINPLTNNINPPNPLSGESLPEKKSRAKPRVQLKTFFENCKANNEKPISGYQPLSNYVEATGLPTDFVQIAWEQFKREFGPGGKNESRKQADWRRHFLNYVEKNYFRLWYAKPAEHGNEYLLTTQGLQAKALMEKAA